MIRRLVAALDERLGVASPLRKTLRYVFPDHWTFMLGEIAMYCFVVLVATGIFLTFYYVPSDSTVHYQGSYLPLQGTAMSGAYESVLKLSF
ncbi:MAG TPA: cytochrome b, partial [Solirubrobacterales bacterium]|nr:cytochrome b [Solirubrobacterales bacterium]